MDADTPSIEDLIAGMPAGFGFGAVPLGTIASAHRDHLRAMTDYDPLQLACCFGALLAEPGLQSNCVRLEVLTHLSLACARGTRKPTNKFVGRLFKAFGKGMTGRLEDPAEDIFVSLIITPRGHFRVLEGIWELAGFHTQRMVSALELIPDDVGPRYREIRERVYALLKLSELVCERAQLPRYAKGNQNPEDKIPSDVLGRLEYLGHCIRFTEAELKEHGISPTLLGAFGFVSAARASLASDSIGHSLLERFPIILRKGDFHLVLPTAVTAAIRRFILEAMNTASLRSVFASTLAFELAGLVSRTPLLGDKLGAPMEFKKTDSSLIGAVMFDADRGRFINFIFFADTLENFDDSGGLVGMFPTTTRAGLERDIVRWIDEAHKAASAFPNFKEGITLLISCGIGRAILDLTPDKLWPNWRVESVGAPDLFSMSWLPDFKPLSLYRLFTGRDRIEEIGINLFNINGLLNLIAWARSLGGHLVPHASVPAEFGSRGSALLMVGQNALLQVRQEVADTWDPHALQTIDAKWVAVRKEGESIFDEDRARPFYVSEEIPDRWPMAVYETGKRAWWVHLETTDATTGHWAFQRYQMLKTWICLAAPVLDEAFPTLPPGPILWKAKFEGEIGDRTGQDETRFLSLEETLPFIDVTIERSTVFVTGRSGFENAIYNPINIAERALVAKLVEGVALLAKVALDTGAREAIVAKIVTNPKARQSHAFMARHFRDFVRPSVWSSPVTIDVDDAATFKLGLGWRTRKRSEGGEIRGREACTAYLNGIVTLLENEICSDLRQFERRSVIMFALMNHESAIASRDNWRRTSSAVVALHKDREATLTAIAHHEAELNAVFQATRLMVEFAICECPLQNAEKPGHLDMSRIMAKIMMTCGLGGWSDSIHWQAMEPLVQITPLGDIHANVTFQEEVLNPYGRAMSDVLVEESIKNYEHNLREPKPTQTDKTTIEADFLEAFEEQFGASFDTVRKFIDYTEEIGIKKGEIVFSAKCSDLLAAKAEDVPLNSTAIRSLVDFLTFNPRARWRDIPDGFLQKDLFPWRVRRRLSVLRKPLIQLDEASDPTILIAPGILRDAFGYMLRNYHTGDFPRWQLAPKMKRWSGKARDNMGKEFSAEVAARLKGLEWEVETEVRVTKLLGKSFDQDYGDIDVLAWKRSIGRVLLVECKDVQHKKIDGEIAEQLMDFRGELNEDGKPDYLLRHLRRIEVASGHIPEIGKYLKLGAPPSLEGHLVFKNPVPMKFAWERMKERMALHLFSELDRI